MEMHAIIRTNPKGQPGVGRCSRCGKEGLTFRDMNEECPNSLGVTQEDALLSAVNPDAPKREYTP